MVDVATVDAIRSAHELLPPTYSVFAAENGWRSELPLYDGCPPVGMLSVELDSRCLGLGGASDVAYL